MTCLQERLRNPPNVELLAHWAEQAAERIDADEVMMRSWLALIKTCQKPDYDNVMISVMHDIRARLKGTDV